MTDSDKLDDLSERLSRIEATQGKIDLTPSLVALIITILLPMFSAVGCSAVNAFQTREIAEQVKALATAEAIHERLPIHTGARYEVNDLLRRMSKMDGQPVREVPEITK